MSPVCYYRVERTDHLLVYSGVWCELVGILVYMGELQDIDNSQRSWWWKSWTLVTTLYILSSTVTSSRSYKGERVDWLRCRGCGAVADC